MTLFECDNLTLGYAGTAVAEKLSFYVEKGDYLCIIGENGSGKSTLIKTLLGLAKPLSGKINRSDEFSPERIGYMPQQTKMQRDFPASVKEIVMSAFLGGKGFFAQTAYPQYASGKGQLAGHCDVALDRPARQLGKYRRSYRYAGGRPVLRNGSCRDVDVQVMVLEYLTLFRIE